MKLEKTTDVIKYVVVEVKDDYVDVTFQASSDKNLVSWLREDFKNHIETELNNDYESKTKTSLENWYCEYKKQFFVFKNMGMISEEDMFSKDVAQFLSNIEKEYGSSDVADRMRNLPDSELMRIAELAGFK